MTRTINYSFIGKTFFENLIEINVLFKMLIITDCCFFLKVKKNGIINIALVIG